MRIAAEKLKELCVLKGMTLSRLLKNAGVSKNAYYSLARKDSLLPKSVLAIANHLGVRPSAFLEEGPEENQCRKTEGQACPSRSQGCAGGDQGARKEETEGIAPL